MVDPAAEAAGGPGVDSSVYLWLFLLGQLLHGAGAAPLYTLGVTFIDENVSKKMSSVYLGEGYYDRLCRETVLEQAHQPKGG